MTAIQKKPTISTTDRGLLGILIKRTTSTIYQSTVSVQQSNSTSKSRTTRVPDHSPSTMDYNNISLESYLEELEWQTIIDAPHVQRGILRLADEAQQQIAAGEIEEGGFAIE